uniref:Uncharacterized protein n=1 Tax=Anguilla anguilla TaxID=7936 RepID=A0A0E9TBW5_ANGAN
MGPGASTFSKAPLGLFGRAYCALFSALEVTSSRYTRCTWMSSVLK